MELCEVRIPTHKRPHLLKRAIGSLLLQTYKEWVAIVMDDSPEQEGRAVVNFYGDNRIIYKPNKTHLGRSANLDQAFQSSAYVGGHFAFVLEDDNYLYPDFIIANIESINRHKVNIILRNQKMSVFPPLTMLQKNETEADINKTTRGDWFISKIYEPIEMYSFLFFHTGISNGGLFWNTISIASNLQVGPAIEDSSHQEMFRCLQIREPIFFEAKPLCVYTFFVHRTDISEMSNHETRLFNRAQQSIYMYLLKQYGDSVIGRATDIANEKNLRPQLERILLDALYTSYDFKFMRGLKFIRTLGKAIARYLLYKDPLEEYYEKT